MATEEQICGMAEFGTLTALCLLETSHLSHQIQCRVKKE
jgi:hypothetical protein